jgi:hypothetical protein
MQSYGIQECRKVFSICEMAKLLAMDDSPLCIESLEQGAVEIAGIEAQELTRKLHKTGVRKSLQSSIRFARQQRIRKHREESFKKTLLPENPFTPAMLRFYLEWTGDTCAFPLCDEPLSAQLQNMWHLCSEHNTKRMLAINYRLTKIRRTHGTTTERNQRAESRSA